MLTDIHALTIELDNIGVSVKTININDNDEYFISKKKLLQVFNNKQLTIYADENWSDNADLRYISVDKLMIMIKLTNKKNNTGTYYLYMNLIHAYYKIKINNFNLLYKTAHEELKPKCDDYYVTWYILYCISHDDIFNKYINNYLKASFEEADTKNNNNTWIILENINVKIEIIQTLSTVQSNKYKIYLLKSNIISQFNFSLYKSDSTVYLNKYWSELKINLFQALLTKNNTLHTCIQYLNNKDNDITKELKFLELKLKKKDLSEKMKQLTTQKISILSKSHDKNLILEKWLKSDNYDKYTINTQSENWIKIFPDFNIKNILEFAYCNKYCGLIDKTSNDIDDEINDLDNCEIYFSLNGLVRLLCNKELLNLSFDNFIIDYLLKNINNKLNYIDEIYKSINNHYMQRIHKSDELIKFNEEHIKNELSTNHSLLIDKKISDFILLEKKFKNVKIHKNIYKKNLTAIHKKTDKFVSYIKNKEIVLSKKHNKELNNITNDLEIIYNNLDCDNVDQEHQFVINMSLIKNFNFPIIYTGLSTDSIEMVEYESYCSAFKINKITDNNIRKNLIPFNINKKPNFICGIKINYDQINLTLDDLNINLTTSELESIDSKSNTDLNYHDILSVKSNYNITNSNYNNQNILTANSKIEIEPITIFKKEKKSNIIILGDDDDDTEKIKNE